MNIFSYLRNALLHAFLLLCRELQNTLCRRHFIRAGILLFFCTAMELSAALVTVSGSGATREAALQEAFKEAVRQGIGTYIESSTMIRNDEIIHESIIELAYGYVENYTVLSESKRDEVYTVKIEANVSNQEVSAVLANILPAETLTEKDRERLNIQLGNDITAQINQHLQEQRKAAIDKVAAKICRKIFEEYRAGFLLTYEFIPDKIQVSRATETEVNFSVDGTIRTNPDLYNLLLNSMVAKFERVLHKKIDTLGGQFYFKPSNDFDYKNDFGLSVNDRTVEGSLEQPDSYSAFAIPYNSGALRFYHGNSFEDKHDTVIGNVEVYHLNDIPFLNTIYYKEYREISATLLVYLVDKKGNIIWGTHRLEIMPLHFSGGLCKKNIITPYFQLSGDHRYYNSRFHANPLDWGYSYPKDWPSPCLERKSGASFWVPIKIARNVAGVKSFLQNDNPKGEALLNQLLKGGKK